MADPDNSPSCRRQWFAAIAVCTALTALKLWMFSAHGFMAVASGKHDDALFISLADYLRSGEWLGPYSEVTLFKGVGYPMWIAMSADLGVPLLWSQQLLYVAACVVACIALRSLLRSPWVLTGGYTLLLFNSATLSSIVATRAIRAGIYPALSILVVAALVGMVIHAGRSRGRFAVWTVLLMVSFTYLWHTREEGIWLVPIGVFAYAVIVLRLWSRLQLGRISDTGSLREARPTRETVVAYAVIMALPLFGWWGSTKAICYQNASHYGADMTLEVRAGAAFEAYNLLSQVKPQLRRPAYPIPQEARKRIYAVSPAFRELEEYFEGDPGREWVRHDIVGDGRDISAGFLYFVIRDAAAGRGHYHSFSTATEYFQRVSQEVLAAFESGQLERVPARASMVPTWRISDVPLLGKAFVGVAVRMAGFRGLPTRPRPSVGPTGMLEKFHAMTLGRLNPVEGGKLSMVRGWAFGEHGTISLQLVGDGTPVPQEVVRHSSEDVFRHFQKLGKEIDEARAARFVLEFRPSVQPSLRVTSGQGVFQVSLDGSETEVQKLGVRLQLDDFDLFSVEKMGMFRPFRDDMRTFLMAVTEHAYMLAIPVLAFAALILFGRQGWRVVRQPRLLGSDSRVVIHWWVSCVILSAFLMRAAVLAVFYVYAFPLYSPTYQSPGYALALLFIMSVFGFPSSQRIGSDLESKGSDFQCNDEPPAL